MSGEALPQEKVVIHRAFLRPTLLWGAPRTFSILNLAALMELSLLADWHPISMAVLLLLALAVQLTAVQATKRDPYAFAIAIRSSRQQPFYPAKSRHDAPITPYP